MRAADTIKKLISALEWDFAATQAARADLREVTRLLENLLYAADETAGDLRHDGPGGELLAVQTALLRAAIAQDQRFRQRHPLHARAAARPAAARGEA